MQSLPFDIRTGNGFDVHRLVADRPCIICGVTIPFDRGLLGHSDADVALHALSDALLGAVAMRDIGFHFPDTDQRWKGADSRMLLRDITIIAQAPKMLPYIEQMQTNVAADLGLPDDRVSVKATTTERLGFTGREEGIAAMATATVVSI